MYNPCYIFFKFLQNFPVNPCGPGDFSCWKVLRDRRRRQWQPTPVLLPGKSMDGGAWQAAVHGVARSRTRLSDFTFTFHFHALEKEMATHSSVLAWRIPGTGSLVGCRLWGRTESDTTEATQQQEIDTHSDFLSHPKLKDAYSLEGKLCPTQIAYSKAETLLCQQRSIQSRLWFFLWSCMDVRVGL